MNKREFRAAVEQRVDDDARMIEGYAALFNSRSVDLGGFVEVIERGAFARSIGDGNQVFAYWNHNSDFVLGSTRSKTLDLSEDEKGLRFRLDVGRLTDQQLAAVREGDMRMSFGFGVRSGGEAWDDSEDVPVRTLRDVALYEVSPVSTPAYEDTSAALRSLEEARKAQRAHNFNAAAKRAQMKTAIALKKRQGEHPARPE